MTPSRFEMEKKNSSTRFTSKESLIDMKILIVHCLFFALCFLSVDVVKGNDLINVALKKPTAQSDVLSNINIAEYMINSSAAVDGDKNSNYNDGSCSHSGTSVDNFLVVDLMTPFPIHSITITTRQFNDGRLKNFALYVSTDNPLPLPPPNGKPIGQVCKSYAGTLSPVGPHAFLCDHVIEGRYVYLWKPGDTGYLIVCEFEVMARIGGDDFGINFKLFRVGKGKKTREAAFFSPTIDESSSPSRLACIRACLMSGRGYTTAVQLEKMNNVCQCIQLSRIKTSCKEDVADPAWTLMELDSN